MASPEAKMLKACDELRCASPPDSLWGIALSDMDVAWWSIRAHYTHNPTTPPPEYPQKILHLTRRIVYELRPDPELSAELQESLHLFREAFEEMYNIPKLETKVPLGAQQERLASTLYLFLTR